QRCIERTRDLIGDRHPAPRQPDDDRGALGILGERYAERTTGLAAIRERLRAPPRCDARVGRDSSTLTPVPGRGETREAGVMERAADFAGVIGPTWRES